MELLYNGQRIGVAADETVLQALTRQGITTRSSCLGGVCQTCVMRCLEGEIPARTQSGLNPELISKRYFMPCICQPAGDMVLAGALADDFYVPAQLEKKIPDANGITLLFEPLRAIATPLTEVMVRDAQGNSGHFQLSNQPEIDYYFAIHLTNTDNSGLAAGLRNTLQPGEQIQMRAATADDQVTIGAAPDNKPERPKDPPPDLELWAALGEGALLREILIDFYDRVYADPLMMSFFAGFTRQRLVEKQYSFLHQVMTGNKVYFGNRPLRAHHWMVISDALLDHREQIMRDCMRAHGVDEKWIKRSMELEEYYRPDIVKSEPFPLQNNGVDIPLEGFEEIVIDSGSICDGCGGVIESGETVRYHVRKGTIYCARCNTSNSI